MKLFEHRRPDEIFKIYMGLRRKNGGCLECDASPCSIKLQQHNLSFPIHLITDLKAMCKMEFLESSRTKMVDFNVLNRIVMLN